MIVSLVDFVSLFCLCLCYDLLLLVGVLNNGFELLVDEIDLVMCEWCMELFVDSV